ncbi:hypothetical protein EV361DRAFT_324309 [Lentinula raphanica]|nr:hypothetical protein EV361DRAFT_324309 [Lentinula raphanica]
MEADIAESHQHRMKSYEKLSPTSSRSLSSSAGQKTLSETLSRSLSSCLLQPPYTFTRTKMHLPSGILLASFALCLIRCVNGTPGPSWDDDDTDALFENASQVNFILPEIYYIHLTDPLKVKSTFSSTVVITVGDGKQALPQNVHDMLKSLSKNALRHWKDKDPTHYHVVNPISNSVEASKIPPLIFLFSCPSSQYCAPRNPCIVRRTTTGWVTKSPKFKKAIRSTIVA